MKMQAAPTTLDSIRKRLGGASKMPRALEILNSTLRRIEKGEIDGHRSPRPSRSRSLSSTQEPPGEDCRSRWRGSDKTRSRRSPALTSPSGFRSKTRTRAARRAGSSSTMPKSCISFAHRHRREPPSHSSGGRGCQDRQDVHFSTLADIIAPLVPGEQTANLGGRLRYLCRAYLLVVDEIGDLPVVLGGGNPFFLRVNPLREGPMILIRTVASPNGAGCSAIPSSPPLCATGFSTMPSSFKSSYRLR